MSEHISAAAYREQTSKPQKRQKYNAKPVVYDGRRFDSTAEYERYLVLKDMEAKGEITHLECQPRYDLRVNGQPLVLKPSGRQAFYKADFRYFSVGRNARVVEDVKGVLTKEFMLKQAVVEAMQPGLVIEVVR